MSLSDIDDQGAVRTLYTLTLLLNDSLNGRKGLNVHGRAWERDIVHDIDVKKASTSVSQF